MAFLGIKVPHSTARLLSSIEVSGTKTASSEMHITLLHFGKEWPISELSKSIEAIYQVISDVKPFSVTIDKITCFPQHDGKHAIVSLVNSKELKQLRKTLAKEFEECDIDFSKDFKDYRPHITLSYSEDKDDNFEVDEVEFVVQELVLWGGDHGDDRIFVTFPLHGPEKQKQSLLLQKADIFYKIAGNPPQECFTTSSERRKMKR
jgi:2'-5' RNA ligase